MKGVTSRWILPVIVMSQFFCTSLWFAGNAIIADISKDLHFDPSFLAHLTSAVQFGFIAGTFLFALYTVSDRFSPSLVFFVCAMMAGLSNLGIIIGGIQPTQLLVFRFLTGFFLAGIYPVGMKIASDYYQGGLGKSLGFLVGALVLGTAFPHMVKDVTLGFPWAYVVYLTTFLSVIGGMCILAFVPNGPYRRTGQKMSLTTFMKGFRSQNFRAASFGYFGHMWELYTFWIFVPTMLNTYRSAYPASTLNVSMWSFLIIASGAVACVSSGLLSHYFGVKRIAMCALLLSGLCCLISPLFLFSPSSFLFIAFLVFWGIVVVADSPLFSTLVAQNAPEVSRGTSLTIVNCIGFSITIVSIQCIHLLSDKIGTHYIYMLLAIGPIAGLTSLFNWRTKV